ncbi:DNA phosphorothioation-dependent restriction protein DptF [Stutzerimonas nitrititolerans]|uniref:DNA phosphorothioation-dependent restriction protein DptF n=1 Tax=Stutzerimonas nitrititolerans TaxID=2482751 RepID=A0AA42BEK7_9GAMM|nr:DNA phosphorothioation-dependent restriction protein DptF [Stutzerimonas nitrititolerans]MCO7543268.1 DNA phosphorothioation-dependent restriction protein DptF [Stutzerimonas nitrititolerans]
MSGQIALRDALSVLAKSSRYAVEVERGTDSVLQEYKEYLYVQSPVEEAFVQRLANLEPGEMVFLCGSSGDGKSAIMARHHDDYARRIRFHLDATHSFSPTENAVEALNRLFRDVKLTGEPLAVGINIGMLANYAQEGAEEHNDIKLSFQAFLQSDLPRADHHFISFSEHPKFLLAEDGGRSEFAAALLERLTSTSACNPFFRLLQEVVQEDDPYLHVNFRLLGDSGVQRVVIDTLLKARLFNDQFITARALLDFFHHLLTDRSYLFDNLFSPGDNELVQRISAFDPASQRHRELDDFSLRLGLGLSDADFEKYVQCLKEYGIAGLDSPTSYIRLFFLLQRSELGNNYHHWFASCFKNISLCQYARFWSLHKEIAATESIGASSANTLRKGFYKDTFVEALTRYVNRNARSLRKRHLLIGRRGAFDLAAHIEIHPDFARASQGASQDINYFNAFFTANGKEMPPVKISAGLLELMMRINSGYRPSKHDKSVIVILEEIVESIIEQALKSQSLYVYNNEHCIKFKKLEDGSIEVQGES